MGSVESYNRMLLFLDELQRRRGIRFGLRRLKECLDKLDSPQKRFLSVHVVGTKGKGSTAAMLQSILVAAGYEAALYTSPHLVSFNERFRIGRRPVAREELLWAFHRVAQATGNGGDIRLTTFEWITAMAFLLFAEAKVPLAVLEAGMGGRLDATRPARGPIALVSRIGLDHQLFLGSTPAAIAAEKMGILSRGGMAITVPQPPGARLAIKKAACREGYALIDLGRAAQVTVHGTDGAGTCLDLLLGGRRWPRLFIPLSGRHQAWNAALAVAGAQALSNHGLPVNEDAVRLGLAATIWPGRCRVCPGAPPLILDVAHTPESARALADFAREIFPERKVAMVLGILADKDITGIIEEFKCLRPGLYLAPCPSERTAKPEIIAAVARRRGLCVSGIMPSVAAAFDAARSAERAGSGLVIVTGSLFTVGEVMRFMDGNKSEVWPGF